MARVAPLRRRSDAVCERAGPAPGRAAQPALRGRRAERAPQRDTKPAGRDEWALPDDQGGRRQVEAALVAGIYLCWPSFRTGAPCV